MFEARREAGTVNEDDAQLFSLSEGESEGARKKQAQQLFEEAAGRWRQPRTRKRLQETLRSPEPTGDGEKRAGRGGADK
ncbi:MAG TPA: hypothetical protein VGL35_01725 [Rhizomicrobium sp.]|jgi:hypothetical protein